MGEFLQGDFLDLGIRWGWDFQGSGIEIISESIFRNGGKSIKCGLWEGKSIIA